MSSRGGDRETSREGRLRALGARQPCCAVKGCRETDPFALIGAYPNIVCYEHQADANCRSVVEDQHTQGKANGPETVPLLGNDHRVADSYKLDWPVGTLRNPDASPLLRAAARIRGWVDVMRVVIERTIASIPPYLESLDAALTETHGPRWWEELDPMEEDL